MSHSKHHIQVKLITLMLLFVGSFLHSFFFFPSFFRATPTAYGGSQARGLIGAAPTGHSHSHSNVGSEPPLQPTPQVMATLDP